MLHQSDLTVAIDAYERSSQEAISRAKSVALPVPACLSFSTKGLTESSIRELAKSVPTGKRAEDRDAEFIYLFRISKDNCVRISDVLDAFAVAKSEQEEVGYPGKKNLCKINPHSDGCRVLYVGRSYGPRERLKDHLRASLIGTYAIHFQAWAAEIDLKVDFFLYRFSGIGDRVVQVIEDGLWDHLKPMLGRRGEK